MKNLTTTQKRQIARLAVEKSETIENGTMHVYSNGSGFEIIVNSEYRDDEHEHVASLNVWNEDKPCTQAAFIRQLENIS